MIGYFFQQLPLWVIALLFLAVLSVAVELGFRVGLRKRKQWPDAEIGGGGVVLTAMMALLGLILAFTYSASASRYDARKQAVIVEANDIGTAFLRAGLVDDPGRTELRQALAQYARTRIVGGGRGMSQGETEAIIQRTLQAQARLWPITEAIVQRSARGPIEASLVAAVNEVIDQHTIRIAGLMDKLPGAVLCMLMLIACGSMAVTGFNAGVSGCISRWRLSMFSLVLSGVLFVIIDLDRPREGFVRVSLASLVELVEEMDDLLARGGGATPGRPG